MRSQQVLRNQAAMEQRAPGAYVYTQPMYGAYGYGGYGGTWVVDPIAFRGYYAIDPTFSAADRFVSIGLTCDAWRAMTPDARRSRVLAMLFNASSSTASADQQRAASQFVQLIDTYCTRRDIYDFGGLRPWFVQAVSQRPTPAEVQAQSNLPGKAPGSIGSSDRQRMLNSLTPDEMDTYSYLSPDGRSEYEDRWLAAHPPGTTSPATSYRFAESTLGLANGTINSVIASNDRAQSEQLAAQTARTLADMAARREAAREPLERARIELQMETIRQSTQQAIAISQQGGINTQTIVIGAVAAVALLAGAYVIASQVRKNPVVSRSGSRVFIPMRLLPDHEKRRERRNPSEGETVYQLNTNDHDSFGEFTHRASTIDQMEKMAKSDRYMHRGLHVLKIHNAGGGKLEWEIVAGHGKGEKGVAHR